MHKIKARLSAAIGFGFVTVFAVTTAFAAEKNIGKHSQEEIRTACNAAGGDLLGVSESGSYGCEVPSKGTMVLCNKNQECTGYTPARTRLDRYKVLISLELDDVELIAD